MVPPHHGQDKQSDRRIPHRRAPPLKTGRYKPIVTHAPWFFMKRKENLTSKQTAKLLEVLQYNLKTIRVYLSRKESQRF